MKPLENVRILAVEQYGAGPFGSAYLTNMGAEVIKIESPIVEGGSSGDISRNVGPYFIDNNGETDDSLFYQGLNFDKKSLGLKLNTNEGAEIFRNLAKTADAVLTNLRGDVPERLGLTYDQLKSVNERIVCAHLTGYGRDNDRINWPGYDYLMQAESGYFHLTGEPDAPPTRFGLSMVDFMTGVTTSLALVSALYGAKISSLGRDVDVSLFDVALYNLNYLSMWSLNADAHQTRAPRSTHFSLTPCQLYKTQDGWIYIMCNKEKFWEKLCEIIGSSELVKDPRFISYKTRLTHRDILTEILDKRLSTRPTSDWMDRFKAKVPASPVLTLQDALSNPFLAETGRIIETQTGHHTGIKSLRNPIRYTGDDTPLNSAPKMGEHTDRLLLEIGMEPIEIQRLRDRKVIQ